MEKTAYGQGFLASLFDELGRWVHLASKFFEANHNTFAVFSIALMALVSVAVLFYLLPRSRIGRKLGVTLATAAGVALIGQALLAVSVPQLYENYGRGRVASCPILERDADGNLIYEPHPVEIDGEQRIAMIARKMIYQVEATPVVGYTDGRETVGLLLTNAESGTIFPVFCGIVLDEEGEQLLLSLKTAQRPVPVDAIVAALLMPEKGFTAFEKLFDYNPMGRGNPGVEMFAEHLASQLTAEDILPLNPEELLMVMEQAKDKVVVVNVATILIPAYKKALADAGMSDELSYLMAELLIDHFQQRTILPLLTFKTPFSRFVGDEEMLVLKEAGMTKEQAIAALETAVRQTNVAYSNIYAQEVRKLLEAAKLETRKSLVVLPGKAPWYLIDIDAQQGQSGQEGQEGEPSEEQGENQPSDEAEDAVNEARKRGEQSRMNNKRFGRKTDNSSSNSGNKQDSDRS